MTNSGIRPPPFRFLDLKTQLINVNVLIILMFIVFLIVERCDSPFIQNNCIARQIRCFTKGKNCWALKKTFWVFKMSSGATPFPNLPSSVKESTTDDTKIKFPFVLIILLLIGTLYIFCIFTFMFKLNKRRNFLVNINV